MKLYEALKVFSLKPNVVLLFYSKIISSILIDYLELYFFLLLSPLAPLKFHIIQVVNLDTIISTQHNHK